MVPPNIPSPDHFFNHFRTLMAGCTVEYFDYDCEKCAIVFLDKYDSVPTTSSNYTQLEVQIINDNFTVTEISDIIDKLKNNKSPGFDLIPVEFIKTCKPELLSLITDILNYIINSRDFPDIWAEGIRTSVSKNDRITDENNYRSVTVLSVFTKIFEMAVNNRLNFVSTAYDTAGRFNGGFTQGSWRSDNIFILQGLIERLNILGKPIFMCMVDFCKAFDLVNRYILFFKLIKSGVHGKVIDTLRSLYKKTYYRVKCHERLSPIITENIGVYQGVNASPTLFRHFLSDLGDYLHTHCGLCITDDIIVHLLWADDLVLISDSHKCPQKLLNGLHEFCAKNLMIVNEVKTKVLIYGQKNAPDIYFNGQRIEAVQSYKYLGNIISTISSAKGDICFAKITLTCVTKRRRQYSEWSKN